MTGGVYAATALASAKDDEQARTVSVLLVDEPEGATSVDAVPEDASLASVRQPVSSRWRRVLNGEGTLACRGGTRRGYRVAPVASSGMTAGAEAALAATRRALGTGLARPCAGHPSFHRRSGGLSFRTN